MKIVVVGGTGLIGKQVVARLAGHDVVTASPSRGINAETGDGLAAALAGADVVIDVMNGPSFEPSVVRAFFETTTRNLLAGEKQAGVKHHVALSIVGTDLPPDSGYFAAKASQERLIRAGGVPYTIVRATQFFEFIEAIAQSGTDGAVVRIPNTAFQPVASADVAAAIVDVALAAPRNAVVDVAGPERGRFGEMVARVLAARGDRRDVVTDEKATYFGRPIDETSLVPRGEAVLGKTHLQAWLQE